MKTAFREMRPENRVFNIQAVETASVFFRLETDEL